MLLLTRIQRLRIKLVAAARLTDAQTILLWAALAGLVGALATMAFRESIRLATELLVRRERLTILSQEWLGATPDVRATPDTSGFRYQLVCGYALLGRLLHRTGRLAEAEAAYRQSLAYPGQQPDSQDDGDWITVRAYVTAWLGDMSRLRGHVREAEQSKEPGK